MRHAKEFYRFLKHIAENRSLLWTLTKNEFKKQYLGSYFGLAWAFIQPLTFLLVIWFVFTYGFRSAPHGDTPYFLWLASGMIPWFFIANAMMLGTNAVTGNAFLVKKVAFRVSILPLVQIGSALVIHLSLIVFLAVMYFIYGYKPSIYWLQLPYYLFCSVLLVLGISWMTSAVRVFVKDVGNVVGVVLQIGFWATPIFWNVSMLSSEHRWIVELNPAFYIVQGYRNMFVRHEWFWETPELSLYYLCVAGFLFVLGALVFKRLRPHFGDVL